MADRDQMLAEFQAFTDIENIEECIAILEQHDWNLMEAVQNAMAGMDTLQDTPLQFSSASVLTSTIPDFTPPSYAEAVSNIPIFSGLLPPYVTHADGGAASTSNVFREIVADDNIPVASGSASSAGNNVKSTTRLLNFNIQYRDRNVPLVLSDAEQVGKLKELLSDELGVAVILQQLSGWVTKYDGRVVDTDYLKDLKLPKENTLYLITPTCQPAEVTPSSSDDGNVLERLSQTFTLDIRFKDQDKVFKLNFPGSRTIQEVKHDVYTVTDVPVRHQVWSGWPEDATDDSLTLAGCGIGFPCHNLEVGRVTNSDHKRPVCAAVDAECISDDDFEDAQESFMDEDNFSDTEIQTSRRPESLMPDDVQDEDVALRTFTREFSNRYGECHPVFFIGKLEDSIKEALMGKARERKLLAIYLHHDSSILANVFCSQVMCAETVVSYLSTNFITWAWDLTSETNKARLLIMATKHFGTIAANTVRNFKADQLPILLLISRSRGSNEVVNVIHGNTTLDGLMTQLIHEVEVFNQQLKAEIREEDERDARESMKAEQDDAYQMSLAADQVKMEIKKREEEEERQRRDEEDMIRQVEEAQRQEDEAQKQAFQESLASALPDEPPVNSTEPVATLRIRCPEAKMLTRRFLAQNPLQLLLNYITSEGYHSDQFKVLTTYPRKDLTQLDPNATLQELKLFPQETLILEEI